MKNRYQTFSDKFALDATTQLVVIWDEHSDPEGFETVDEVVSVVSDDMSRRAIYLVADINFGDLSMLADIGSKLKDLGSLYDALVASADPTGWYDVWGGDSCVRVQTIEEFLDEYPPSWVVQTWFDHHLYSETEESSTRMHAQQVVDAIGAEFTIAEDVFNDDRVTRWPTKRTGGYVVLRTEVTK